MNTQIILMEVISKTNKLLNTIKSNGMIIQGVTRIPILSETSISERTSKPGIYYASVTLPDTWATITGGEVIFEIQIVEDIDGKLEDTFLKFKYNPYSERPYVDYMERLYLDSRSEEEEEYKKESIV